jgi:hypothetical protein
MCIPFICSVFFHYFLFPDFVGYLNISHYFLLIYVTFDYVLKVFLGIMPYMLKFSVYVDSTFYHFRQKVEISPHADVFTLLPLWCSCHMVVSIKIYIENTRRQTCLLSTIRFILKNSSIEEYLPKHLSLCSFFIPDVPGFRPVSFPSCLKTSFCSSFRAGLLTAKSLFFLHL